MTSKLIPRIVLAILLLGVYLATLAPGLTWANDGADGGDLITAAATNGVAHPSGYPTYLLLARLFQFIPIGSLAFRTNLMSALTAVCTALVVYETVNTAQNQLASLAAAYAFGLSPLYWSQAVITEVYALHVLFIAVLLFLSTKDARHFLFGIILGLGIGNHITTIFLLPLLFHKEKQVLLRRGTGVALGLMVYLSLPLRAMFHPPINWGNPVTLENLIWLVSGKLYQGELLALESAMLPGRIRSTAALFLDQFGVLGVLIGFMGLIVYYKSTRLNRNMIWISLAFLIFPLMYDTRDSFLYLLPSFLCFAIWIGEGLGNLMNAAAQRSARLGIWVGLIFIAVVFIRAGGQWSQVDASRDHRAENFGREMMANTPKDAILFAKSDQAVLTLWYFHYALKERPDLVVIATDLLENKWYQESIRNNYPDLKLPDGFFMFPEVVAAHNPGRTICYVERSLSEKCDNRQNK
jgi:hypothetical protein